ncbi:pyrophosphate-energized vacuolar membrane proton pump 1-like [Vicia villosa]|uniref:pyrophosphate-energized vacuolar membrane proton pump 1-like n=1 Tax=Vicia villosa TaxID=3911 RepID=UPI00273C04BA|nr:pyrophosphate-energized vacuolar membrane proton pump 1-like [Vicia villosa]
MPASDDDQGVQDDETPVDKDVKTTVDNDETSAEKNDETPVTKDVETSLRGNYCSDDNEAERKPFRNDDNEAERKPFHSDDVDKEELGFYTLSTLVAEELGFYTHKLVPIAMYLEIGSKGDSNNSGDDVGDIAGIGSDLFGSYAEASCVALVVASISSFGIDHQFTAMLFPLIISFVGLLVCLLTTLFATDFFEIKLVKEIEPALKKQLVISTVLMTIGIAIVSWIALPSSFTSFDFGEQKVVKNWQLFLCVSVGLWAGLIIGFVTQYYTSNAYSPVQDVADSRRTGAATNVIFGLALGYKSVIIPIFAIAISISVSFSFAAMYGVAVAALGMLSTIATGLAIDAYGPISDNAGGIGEMAGMSHRIRERTDALDAAGNTTAAIGKVQFSSFFFFLFT